MTMTSTRRSNLIKAIRKGLLLSYAKASRVVDHNWMSLACMEPRPLHELTVYPCQSQGNSRGDWSGTAQLFIGEEYLGFINVPAGLMEPVLTASLARAYQLPADLIDFYEEDLDRRMGKFSRMDDLDLDALYGPLDMAA